MNFDDQSVGARGHSGRGCRIDVAMTDNLFPFMYWALGEGWAAGQWPGNGTGLVCGGTPRYRLYATLDGKAVAAAPIEQKFWEELCDIIGLEADLRDDSKDPARTAERIAEIIAGEPAQVWRDRFAGRDCCCSVVADLREALALQATALGEDGAAGALMFTCNGRGRGMFGVADHDADAFEASLAAPVGGFFAAGEIGPVAGRNFLHGFTATLAVFAV